MPFLKDERAELSFIEGDENPVVGYGTCLHLPVAHPRTLFQNPANITQGLDEVFSDVLISQESHGAGYTCSDSTSRWAY